MHDLCNSLAVSEGVINKFCIPVAVSKFMGHDSVNTYTLLYLTRNKARIVLVTAEVDTSTLLQTLLF